MFNDSIVFDSIKAFDLIMIPNLSDEILEAHEIDSLQNFIESGRSLLCLTQENSKTTNRCNQFLSQFGMKIVSDGVVRTVYSKYLHPKNALIMDGILHPSLNSIRDEIKTEDITDLVTYQYKSDDDSISFVYPLGCSIDVQAPSQPLLSSGMFSFPCKRPIACSWEDLSKTERGERSRIVLVGSSMMFTDEWINKERNEDIFINLIRFLLHDGVSLDYSLNRKGGRIEESRVVPDIEALSERLRWCLEEQHPLPQDITHLLIRKTVSYDTSKVPQIIQLYKDLKLEKEPLSLITPDFLRPTPPLLPAVFPPKALLFDPPPLELFDLDEELADPLARLGCLALNSQENNLETFIREAGTITSIGTFQNDQDERRILFHVFRKVRILPFNSFSLIILIQPFISDLSILY